jgi:hypothetical protein
MSRKESRIAPRILIALLASMVTMSISAVEPTKRPTLVVGIMVDGLREDYLELLKGYFGNDGFNRLMTQGVMLENVDYGPGSDYASATAMIYTGTSASVNGIASATAYDAEKKISYPIVLDPSKIGNYTDETYSPAALLVSTLSDEIRIDAGGTGYVYSIAPDATQSILMSGHAGNSAFWINDVTGKWATTTYYKDVPATIQTRNYRQPLSHRLDTLVWTPSMSLDRYPDLPEYKRHYAFSHRFLEKDKNRYRAYKQSAPVNAEVTSIASDYIKTLSLGQRDVMDMLNIGYTLVPYTYGKETDNRLELMDSYIKLDRQLAQLFSAIDRTAGLNNTLIFLAGTPVPVSGKRDEEQWGIPTGEFSSRRAISLLNVYLMAKHGNGEWVSGFHDNQFYLNHKLIKEHALDVKDLRADAADFVARMSGVSSVVTIDDVCSGDADNSHALRRNINLNTAGDLLVNVNPGWEIVDEVKGETKRTVSRTAATSAPVFILAPRIAPQRIGREIDASIIAPTVARLLRIRSPNASSNKPLRL